MLSTGMGERGASIGRQHVILSTGMRRLGIAYCEMSTGSLASCTSRGTWRSLLVERHCCQPCCQTLSGSYVKDTDWVH